MIDRVDLTRNERDLWLSAFAQAACCMPDEGVPRLQRAEHYAKRADAAVGAYRELVGWKRPQEPVR